jgi:hypothetical protein
MNRLICPASASEFMGKRRERGVSLTILGMKDKVELELKNPGRSWPLPLTTLTGLLKIILLRGEL